MVSIINCIEEDKLLLNNFTPYVYNNNTVVRIHLGDGQQRLLVPLFTFIHSFDDQSHFSNLPVLRRHNGIICGVLKPPPRAGVWYTW